MEISYNNQKHLVHNNSNGYFIESTEGKHYCQDGYCQYCESSSPENDTHKFSLDFPEKNFIDDQGNLWIYYDEIRRDESQSFGWWESTSRWFLFNPANRIFAVGKNINGAITGIAIWCDQPGTSIGNGAWCEYSINIHSGIHRFDQAVGESFGDALTWEELKQQFPQYAERLALQTVTSIGVKKVRRRIEDALRKADSHTILRIAELLHIRQD